MKVKPVAIMFSEYYFYITAFIDDEEVIKDFDVINDSFPTIYRIDRIKNLKVLDEKFIFLTAADLRKVNSENRSNSCIEVNYIK